MSASDNLGPHLLGRVAPPNFKHVELHPLMAAAPPQGIEVNLARPTLSVYDQGQTPRCVAYSTSKVVNWFNKYAFDPDWLYAQCKLIDGYPNEDGTNEVYAADVLRTKGHWRTINGVPVKVGARLQHGIQSNTWATSVDQIRAAFYGPKPQPVLTGINWYEAWFRPTLKSNGEAWLQHISQAGQSAGGHEIGIWACSDSKQAFGYSNTWGKSWPNPAKPDSVAWISYNDMDALLGQGADACILQDLSTR